MEDDNTSRYMSTDPLKFLVDKYQQRKVLCEEVDFYEQNGGASWLLGGLNTSQENGISSSSIKSREETYGHNRKEKETIKSFCQLACEALNDLILIVMCVAGVASIIIGLIKEKDHRETAWIEGFAILLAVFIVVMVQAVNDLKKEKQFQKLNEEAENGKSVSVLRDGKENFLPISEVVTGDIVKIRSGMEIAGDGIMISGYNVSVDESSMTGETDSVHKNYLKECVRKRNEIQASGKSSEQNIHAVDSPVMLAGTKVVGGTGYMVVTAVGEMSSIGKIQKLVEGDNEPTPLQMKLEKIARDIGLFGLVSAIIVFTVLLIIFLVKGFKDKWSETDKIIYVNKILDYFMIAITILIVAIPEGLPLAVTLSLAFSVQKMMADNNLVRKLQACETMGGANIICSDKTGTLTKNEMFLTNFWNIKDHVIYDPVEVTYVDHKSFMDPEASKVFENVITLNSTEDPSKKEGNPTEQATLKYLHGVGFNVMEHRKMYKPVFESSFSSDRKRMSTVIKFNNDKTFVFMKGASEWMLEVSQKFLDLQTGQEIDLDFELKKTIEESINGYAVQALRTIGLVYKEVSEEDLDFENYNEKGVFNFELDGFTMVGICGIKDTIKSEVPDEVIKCHKAGIDVKMVTGDNIVTARAIALEVNIITKENENDCIVMEGIDFLELVGGVVCSNCRDKPECKCAKNKKEKKLIEQENKKNGISEEVKIRNDVIKNGPAFDRIAEKLKVLARSRPEDKYALVVGLKERGNVVAVTGDGTNDAPALAKADVGFAMNIAGTEVAKQAADILLLDDNFKSIVIAAKWGRNIYDAIKKFLQFQLTVNVVAVLTTFISAVSIQEPILSAVQMLWINLIMDTLAALALATEPPRDELLDRKPHSKKEYIISPKMIKHILVQSIMQTIILLIVVFMGDKFLFDNYRTNQTIPGTILVILGGAEQKNKYDKNNYNNQYSVHFTYIFNIFVMLQIFNFLNCRMIHDEINIFKYIGKSTYFIVICIIIFILQILLLTLAGPAIRVHQWGLYPDQWGLCIAFGLLSLLFRFIFAFIPIENCCKKGIGNQPLDPSKLNAKSSMSIRKSHNRNFYNNQATIQKKGSKVILN